MFRLMSTRGGHYLTLLLLAGVLYFPWLGGPSLWDIDEGNNAEAAREMLESDNWVIPTFNYDLRVDKPALLYWLQIQAYMRFGINEFSARLPSAIAATLTVLVVYELGRSLFGATTGLLGAIVLASNIAFGVAARFANPDALLSLFCTSSMLFFWMSYSSGGRAWFIWSPICMGLAVLTKGPVGLVLPATVITLFLWRQGRLGLLWDRRYLLACLLFGLVAAPWYAWVAADTKASFLSGFLLKHNVGRFLSPMENHRGPVYYYLIVLAAGLAPWSIFLGPTVWAAFGRRVSSEERGDVYSFLWWWIGLYLLFFTISGTKLPNYILPLYPPAALLTGRFLERWLVQGVLHVPVWCTGISLTCLGLAGLGIAFGLSIAGGVVAIPGVQMTAMPGLRAWAMVGLIPILGAITLLWCFLHERRRLAIGTLSIVAVSLSALLLGPAAVALDEYKAPRALVHLAKTLQVDEEVRVGTWEYFQPSLVFYCQREVVRPEKENKLEDLLMKPIPVYLFVPETVWENLPLRQGKHWRVVARHHDLYRRCEVLVVSNGQELTETPTGRSPWASTGKSLGQQAANE